jgi:hypothetical protein
MLQIVCPVGFFKESMNCKDAGLVELLATHKAWLETGNE